MECKLKKLFVKPDGGTHTHIGKGFKLDDADQETLHDINLIDTNRKAHLFVFATTRTGKTRLIEHMIEQDIMKGNSVVVIDPKIDNDLFSKVYQSALKTDRLDDLMLLSPVFSQFSIKINPLSHFYMPEEPIGHIMAGVPTEDEFFYGVALETTTVIVRSLLLIKKDTNDISPLRFEDVWEYAHYEGIKRLKDLIQNIKSEETKKLITLINQVLASPPDYFTKVSNTLRTTLTQMTIGAMGDVMGNVKSNAFVERLEKGQGVILYVQTGSMLTKKTADILGKVVVSMIQSVTGRYYASGMTFKKPLCLYIDEMSNCVYRGIEDIFNKGGGANLYITGLTQSMADIIAEIGEDRARKLFDNTNTKIFGRVNDIGSAELIVKYGGVLNRHSSIINSHGGITAREVEEALIKTEDVLRLKPREIYYFGFEGEFKGKIAPVRGSEVVVKMPKIVGGNSEQNNQ